MAKMLVPQIHLYCKAFHTAGSLGLLLYVIAYSTRRSNGVYFELLELDLTLIYIHNVGKTNG